MEGLTLDTGALVALERKDRRAVALVESALRDGRRATVLNVTVTRASA